VLASACNNLLDVRSPSRILATSLDNPANAIGGGRRGVGPGMRTLQLRHGVRTHYDELDDAALSQAQFDFDRRTFTAAGGAYATGGCGATAVDRAVSTARFTPTTRWRSWTCGPTPRSPTAAVDHDRGGIRGFSYICWGKPVHRGGGCWSRADSGADLHDREDRFTRAITEALEYPTTTC